MVQSHKINRSKDYIKHVDASKAKERIRDFTEKLNDLSKIQDPADKKSHDRNVKYYTNKIKAYQERLDELES
jgi:hypothetical protein